eukprot:TRINITY_DN1902_c0_g1_i1.p1 TRINITY_DN1902_c0_g1~~TRINITY_DN1902_c0_g1_i1.p1  ORF type:complete len:213 (-),score=44.15 TRINITY_DN1902_c0_g1_i1:56-694(-)
MDQLLSHKIQSNTFLPFYSSPFQALHSVLEQNQRQLPPPIGLSNSTISFEDTRTNLPSLDLRTSTLAPPSSSPSPSFYPLDTNPLTISKSPVSCNESTSDHSGEGADEDTQSPGRRNTNRTARPFVLSIDLLQQPQEEIAKMLGLSVPTFNKKWKEINKKRRWPHRKHIATIKKIQRIEEDQNTKPTTKNEKLLGELKKVMQENLKQTYIMV